MTVRLLGHEEARVLDEVAPEVFDNPIDPRWVAEFFADARHHLAVALAGTSVVGMASALHYVHPDKAPELWVNEVAVTPGFRRRGIGRRLVEVLFDHGRTLGCALAWLGTEAANHAARRLYASAGGTEEAFLVIEFALAPAQAEEGLGA